MQPIIDPLYFFRRKKQNRFWKNQKLIEEDLIKKNIEIVIAKNNIREGKFMVNGVYLIGSVLDLLNKNTYRREPNDLNIYFWVNENNPSINKSIISTIKNLPKPYDLETHVLIFPFYPWDNHLEDFADNLIDVYRLYQHPSILSRYSSKSSIH